MSCSRIEKYNGIKSTLIYAYIAIFMIAIPLIYKDKYYDIGIVKYEYVKYLSMVVFSILIILEAITLFIRRKELSLKGLSKTDYFVIGYVLVNIISYILSPYKEVTFWGFPGWYMGLITQILLALIYYFVSRYLSMKKSLAYFALIPATIVFIIGLMQKFYMDPLGLFDANYGPLPIPFISTIGNFNWYAAYLMLMLAIAICLYIQVKDIKERILLVIFISIAMASLVTTGGDGAYIAFGLIFYVLIFVSLSNIKNLRRIIEIGIISLNSFIIIGIIQRTYVYKEYESEKLSLLLSQSMLTKILLLIFVVMYFFITYRIINKKIVITNIRIIRTIMIIIPIFTLVLLITLMVVVTLNLLPNAPIINNIGYLNFNNEWGTYRGYIWRLCTTFI